MKTKLCVLSLTACAFVHPVMAISVEDADVQLKLTRIELLLKNKELSKAKAVIEELKKQGLSAPDLYSAEASYQFEKGNSALAMTILQDGVDKFPKDKYLADFLNEVKKDNKSFVRVRRTVDLLGDTQMEQSWMAQADVALSDNATRVGAEYEWNDYTTAGYSNIAGATVRGDDSVAIGRINVSHMLDSGQELNGFVAASESDVGGGVSITIPDDYGQTLVSAAYHVPDWGYMEAVAQDGVKDSFSVKRMQQFTKNFRGELDLGVNRYGLDDKTSLVGTYKVGGGFGYSFGEFSFVEKYLGKNAELYLNYDVAGEYVSYAKRRFDVFGTYSKVYPLDSYEIHSLNFSLGKTFGDHFYTEVFGGYSIDRLGGDAPSLGVTVDYEFIEDTSVEFYAVRSLSAENNSEESDSIGIGLKRAF